MSGDLSKYASRCDSANQKKAAHGDMSRLGGERHLDILRSTPQGSQTVLCHHVACQVFFSFFLKKVAQAKRCQDA